MLLYGKTFASNDPIISQLNGGLKITLSQTNVSVPFFNIILLYPNVRPFSSAIEYVRYPTEIPMIVNTAAENIAKFL